MTAAGLIVTLINQSEGSVLGSPIFNELKNPERDDFDDCYYLVFVGMGIELRFSLERQLKTIYFHGSDNSEVGMYSGELPWGLKFSLGKDEIRLLLGEPQYSHKDYNSGSLAESKENWDLYHFDNYSLNIEYGSGGMEIKLVALMSADTVPYQDGVSKGGSS